MGKEDYVMITAIASSVALHITNIFPEIPSWLPAILAGIFKYSVDILNDRKKSLNGGGGGNGLDEKSLTIVAKEVDVVSPSLVIDVDKVRLVARG